MRLASEKVFLRCRWSFIDCGWGMAWDGGVRKVDWMVVLGTNVVTAVLCWAWFSKSGSVEGSSREAGAESERAAAVVDRKVHDDDAPVSGKVAERVPVERGDVVEDDDLPLSVLDQVSESGALSSEVRSKYGLSNEQYVKMQSALSRYWGAMARSAAERIFYDAVASEGAPDGAEIYRLPAMEEAERDGLRGALANSLREVGGEKVSKEIIGGLNGESFGYHGKLDMVFRFKPMVVKEMDLKGDVLGSYVDKSQMSVSFEGIDPVRGESVLEGHSTSKELANTYGNIFVVPVGDEAGK